MNAFTTQRLIESEAGAEATTLHEPAEPFDWAAVERALGEDELGPVEYEQLVFALRRILQWLLAEHPGRAGDHGREKLIVCRLIGLCWSIDPGIFASRPSLRSLARRFKIHPANLSKQTKKASSAFGTKNRDQIEARRTHPMRKTKLPKLTKAQLAQN